MTYELTYIESMDIIGGLSTPSKMPWFATSTSAYDCKTGSKLREVEGSTCSECYACKGQYCFPQTRVAHDRRLRAIDDPRWVDAFVVVLENLHRRTRSTYKVGRKTVKENRFRWHDSGDIQSLEHLKMIAVIAERTPQILHWLPTREFGMVDKFLKGRNTFPPNLVVRMSAPMIGESFPHNPLGLPFSTVGVDKDKKLTQCPAWKQANQCGNCTNCWKVDKNVNYPLH